MPRQPGTPKTGGRVKGTPNKRTAETLAAAERTRQAIVRTIPGAFTGSAHDFLQLVYRDPNMPVEVRLDAAGKAVRFETPALSTTEHKGGLELQSKPLSALIEDIKADAARLGAEFVPPGATTKP